MTASTRQALAAFERAVHSERAAIALHFQAATVHDRAAIMSERVALNHDGERRSRLLQQAAIERARAVSARGRAAHARQRLVDEGVDPDG
jgi:hypothetical protein